ncbi:MAG: type II toxin-antitoxin system HicB family antitoxin [Alphaproteobacteria bacterium]|nr:type II toxin-antitoxin system HicB family antitoxin [Alphaproteobacteria bacterium]
MGLRFYPALIYRERARENWSILFPDFPEIASAADATQDVDQQAMDALATAADVYAEAQRPLPEPSHATEVFDQLPAGVEGFIGVYAVQEPEPLRVNISIDRSLLARLDFVAQRRGQSRSALLAEAARALLEAESRKPIGPS